MRLGNLQSLLECRERDDGPPDTRLADDHELHARERVRSGTNVTINGTNFSGATAVRFNGTRRASW